MNLAMRSVHYDNIDSTNTQARLLAAEHPGEMLLVTAAEQSTGRGRHGRIWLSPRGGAWMSIVWPMRKPPAAYATTSLVAAVAVMRALHEVAPECTSDLQIKWPNDLLLGGRKVAGILCEQCLGGRNARAGALIIGVGINVDFDTVQLGARLRHPATTLQAFAGRSFLVKDVIAAVTRHVLESLTTFEAMGLDHSLLSELRSHLAYVGSLQRWSTAGRVMTGRVRGLDAGGRLLLDCEAGEVACDVGELLADGATSAEELI